MNIVFNTDPATLCKRIFCALSLNKVLIHRETGRIRMSSWRKKNLVAHRIANAAYQHKRRRKIAALEGRTIIPPRDQSLVTPEQRKREQLEANARYKARYPERCREQQRRWKRNNRAKVEAYRKKKFRTDPQWNIARKVRGLINCAFTRANLGKRSHDKSIRLLGCSYSALREHIENQFKPDMSWEHVLSGEIHLDHIKPISTFALTNEAQKLECFSYKNLQPLWAFDNLSKNNKVDYIPSHKPA